MDQRVAVVVDSTASLPPAVAEGQDVFVIPVKITIDGRPVDGPQDSAALAELVKAGHVVGTVSPSPEELVQAYQQIAAQGYDALVAIHVSKELSTVATSAEAAASLLAQRGGPVVHVVDSESAVMGIGWVALAAVGCAAAGGTGEQVRDIAIRVARRTHVWFVMEDLALLRRGRRIGPVEYGLGRSIGVKPVMRLSRGAVTRAGALSTMPRALARMVELASETGRGFAVHATVHHVNAPERAEQLVALVAESGLEVKGAIDIVDVAPEVGLHVGAGAVGLVLSPLDWERSNSTVIDLRDASSTTR